MSEKDCQYFETCETKTTDCFEHKIIAKEILGGKFWIVEEDGKKIATLRINEDNKFILSNETGLKIFENKESITKEFGKDFFVAKITKDPNKKSEQEVHGYSSSTIPYNSMFDIKRKLPLFTKSKESKSIYCAGYYIIKFDKGWVKSFCPKLITLQRYDYQGPFKTELEMKQELSNVNK